MKKESSKKPAASVAKKAPVKKPGAVKAAPADHASTRPPKRTVEQMLKAIPGTGGIITAIAKRLEIARETLYTYMEQYPEVKAAIENERDVNLDVAEQRLMDLVHEGDLKAIMFFLEKKGKDRGWGRDCAVKLSGDEQAPVVVKSEVDLSGLSDEALAAMAAALGEPENV